MKNDKGVKIGDCRNEYLIDNIFGSVSEFARQTEERGDNFTYGNIRIEYNEKRDIHTFYQINAR